MVRHVILWKLKEMPDAEKAAVKAGIKEGLEGLVGKVPGLLEVHVNINGLPTSNADVMLDTTLENFEALKGYAVHPAHVAVADGKVEKDATVMLNITGGGEEHFKAEKELWYLQPSHVFPLEPDPDDVAARVSALFA